MTLDDLAVELLVLIPLHRVDSPPAHDDALAVHACVARWIRGGALGAPTTAGYWRCACQEQPWCVPGLDFCEICLTRRPERTPC
jgi:hypothetical protein